MNDKFTNNHNQDDDIIGQKLHQVSQQTLVNGQFAAELEERLRSAHQPRSGWFMAFDQVSPTLRWVALMVLLALALSWSIKSLIPAPQPSTDATPNGFICPVTQPNGSLPPGTQPSETTNDPNLLGNGQLWTVLGPDGKIYLSPENQRTNGAFETAWPWYRGTDGQLTIQGQRLDAQAEPLQYELPEGFNNFQGSTLIFPTAGCWEITGRVGDAALTFVTEVIFDTEASTPAVVTTPNLVTNGTVTPVAKEGGYDFRGAKLYLEQPLPESPATAHVYFMNREDTPATQQQTRALADRFGIKGEMYTSGGLVYGTNDFTISDGKQSLQVHSETFFTYTSDMAKSRRAYPAPTNPDAEAIIREFLNARGFNFPFRVYASLSTNGYVVQPLAPDTVPIQYESFSQPMMRVVLDENGQVLTIDASLMDYEQTPIGEYGIISAQEAFDKVLDDYVMTGKMEFSHSPTNMPKEWYRTYPDNQPVTVYGYITSYPALDAGKPPLIFINGVSLTGNISGMENLEINSFVGVTGQYLVENGIRRFNVESWDRKVNEVWISGMLSHQGDQVIVTSDDGSGKQYTLADPPDDLPIGAQTPENSLGISGVIENDTLSWFYIQFFEGNSGGGGGGGNGSGFYKLNLSGSPVPFPDPTPNPGANAETIQYVVQENDTLASIASNFGVSVDALMQANGIIENQVITGQTLVIPSTQQATNSQPTGIYRVEEGDTLGALAKKFGTSVAKLHDLNGLTDENIIYVGQELVVPMPEVQEQKVQGLRGYLGISARSNNDGTLTKEYALDVAQNGGSTVYAMEGSVLDDMEGVNGRPILVTGTINAQGKLLVDSYTIPYPGLQFQILKGTQRTEQVDGQNVVIFTTEDGQYYVEFLATNQIPNTTFITGILGDLIQEEVLIIPDETFGGVPVAHVYQSAIIQENSPELEVQANRVHVYDESSDPGTEYTQSDLTINKVELVYFGSNPYYQMNDPNYDQRSPYIEPVWHFQGRYENGTEFDVLIQALKQEFLLPELAPGSLPG